MCLEVSSVLRQMCPGAGLPLSFLLHLDSAIRLRVGSSGGHWGHISLCPQGEAEIGDERSPVDTGAP